MSMQYIVRLGTVIDDPELRVTNTGRSVTNFRIAQSQRRRNEAGEWETVNAYYAQAVAWDDTREYGKPWAQLAAQLRKQDRVALEGFDRTRNYTDRDGNKRSVHEFIVTGIYRQLSENTGSGSMGSNGTHTDPWNNTPPAGDGFTAGNDDDGGVQPPF